MSIKVLGQRIRVEVRPGTGVPLLLCNGIGAGLEVLSPLVDQLDPAIPVIRFDVPGTGGSPNSPLPYGFPYLAWLLGRVLSELGVDRVDVLGLSWGGGTRATVCVPESAAVPAAGVGRDGNRCVDGARPPTSIAEDGHPPTVWRSRVRRGHRRRDLRRRGTH